MRMTPAKMAAAQTADEIRIRIEGMTCDRCQQVCWTVHEEAWLSLPGGTGREVLHFRDHMGQAEAFAWMARVLGHQSNVLNAAERRAAFIEMSPTLFNIE